MDFKALSWSLDCINIYYVKIYCNMRFVNIYIYICVSVRFRINIWYNNKWVSVCMSVRIPKHFLPQPSSFICCLNLLPKNGPISGWWAALSHLELVSIFKIQVQVGKWDCRCGLGSFLLAENWMPAFLSVFKRVNLIGQESMSTWVVDQWASIS